MPRIVRFYAVVMPRHAWQATIRLLQYQPIRVLWVAVAINVVAISLHWLRRGRESALDEVAVLLTVVASTIIVGALLFVGQLIAAPARLWHDAQERIKELENKTKPCLKVEFEDDGSYYRTLAPVEGLILRTATIVVRNTSSEMIHTCSVLLEEVRNKDNNQVSQPSLPLRLSEDSFLPKIRGFPHGMFVKFTASPTPTPRKDFSLFPGQMKRIDVVELSSPLDDNEEPEMYFLYAVALPDHVPLNLPINGAPYTISLRAYANVGQPVEARFSIELHPPNEIRMRRLE